MKPKIQEIAPTDDLFRSRLDQMINMRHELVVLTQRIDWHYLDSQLDPFYANAGRPAIPNRLMVGLQLLKQMYALSDEAVCDRWVENPYFQYLCGETYFQHIFPIQRSSMTHWRHRVGEDFCASLIKESLRVAHQSKAIHTRHLKRVVVDTTVQPKAVTFPTDVKLRYRAIIALGQLAKEHDIPLRQSYVRVTKQALMMSGRYRHAKQLKRARRAEKFIQIRLGRIIRDIQRRLRDQEELAPLFAEALRKANIALRQERNSKVKLYSWHAPEVECIGKGKADKPYEFGCKASITTHVNPAPAGHFILHASALHGRPYDGHTLNDVLTNTEDWTGVSVERAYVDRGYRGHDYPHKHKVFRSGQKRGVHGTIKKELRRRTIVEPVIGHLKSDGHLGRNYLQGILGDKQNVLLSAAGHNFRLLLKWFRKLFLALNLLTFICSRLRNSAGWARNEITVLNHSAHPMIFSMSIMG
jgi:IS5 family transposase